MGSRLPIPEVALFELCERNKIRRLSLFDSRLKGTFNPTSDVDLLVEFERQATITLLDMSRLERELSALLGGLKVDLRAAEDLSRNFRDEVAREAEVQCVAA
jgi:hypothetical protein